MSEYDALMILDPLGSFIADLERAVNLGSSDPVGQDLAFAAAEENALLYELLWRREGSLEAQT